LKGEQKLLKGIVVYEPDSRQKVGFFKVWAIMFHNIIASRELIFQLFRRDFLMAYKKSFIGVGWIFISPIVGIISWVFMNYTGVLNPGDVGIPYPAYVLLGSSLWGLFMGFYGAAAGTLAAGAGFIDQVKFPHEALLFKQTAQHLAGFLINFMVTLVVLFLLGVVPSWRIAFFPIMILPLFFLAAGMGLVVSVIGVVATDLQKGFDFLLGMVLYITPIIYSPNVENHFLQSIIQWNPLTYLVGGVRDMIVYGRIEHIDRYIYASIFAMIVFVFSWRLFFVSEEKVIEKMI